LVYFSRFWYVWTEKYLASLTNSHDTYFPHLISDREHCDWLVSGEQLPQATRSFAGSTWIDYESVDSPTHNPQPSRYHGNGFMTIHFGRKIF
jgi:hypothetical protein